MQITCHFRDCKALLVTSLIHVQRYIKYLTFIFATDMSQAFLVNWTTVFEPF